MIEKMVSKVYWLFGLIMVAGLIHTMIMTDKGNDGTTYSINSIHDSVISGRVFPLRKKTTYIHPKVVYSHKTILLAELIRERFSSSNYDQDLLIAQYINHDTKGLSWPTPLAVASIIEIESQYNKDAISDCGAKGLMQISPLWANQIPSTAYTTVGGNIKYGIKILNAYYRQYNGNEMAAILSYNSGDNAYNKGKAWPTYWWRYKDAKVAFDTLYQQAA